MAAVELGQLRDVAGTAGRIADRVEQDLDPLEARIAVVARPKLDDLGIDGRPRVPDRLDVPLPELAVAAGLRTVVAEHRTRLGQLDRLRPRLHAVLDIGAHDPGGRFRAKGPGIRLLGPRGEPEKLLLDDVGDGADPTLEHVGQLEERGLDSAIAVA